jgi:alpha-mannosidase
MSHRLRLTAEKVAQRLRLISGQGGARPSTHRTLPDGGAADATVEPDLGVSPAMLPKGDPLAWDSYWGEQNLHFVLRSRFTVPRAGATRRCTCRSARRAISSPIPRRCFTSTAGRWPRPTAITTRWTSTRRSPTASPMTCMLHGWTGLTGWPPDPTDRSQLFMRECSRHRHRPGTSGFSDTGRHRAGAARSSTTTAPRKHSILSALDTRPSWRSTPATRWATRSAPACPRRRRG